MMLEKIPENVYPEDSLHHELQSWVRGTHNQNWRSLTFGSTQKANEHLAYLANSVVCRTGMGVARAREEQYSLEVITQLTPVGQQMLDALNQGMVWITRIQMANPARTRRYWKEVLQRSVIQEYEVGYMERLPLPEFADIKRLLVYYVTRAEKLGPEGKRRWFIPRDDGSLDHDRPDVIL